MSQARKARRERQRRLATLNEAQRDAAMDLMRAEAERNRMAAARNQAEAEVMKNELTATKMLEIAKRKMQEDYDILLEKKVKAVKEAMEKDANKQLIHYREVIKKDYAEKGALTKEEASNEMLGEFIVITALVLRDHFGADAAGMKLYVEKLMQLADDLGNKELAEPEGVEPEKCLTLANIVKQLDAEGFNLTETLAEVDRKIEQDKLFRSFPYVYEHKTWTAEDDAILRGMIEKEIGYELISKKLIKTEKACKTRALRLFGTSIQEKIREQLKAKAAEQEAAG